MEALSFVLCCLQAASAVKTAAELQGAYEELHVKYLAAVELVGERDEQLEELQADLADLKQLHRQQLEVLIAQLPPPPGS
jgi:hypothetical protein